MPFPYVKAYMLTAVPRGENAEKDRDTILDECRVEIIEKAVEQFKGVEIIIMHIPTKKEGYDFFVAVDEKEAMPWIGKK